MNIPLKMLGKKYYTNIYRKKTFIWINTRDIQIKKMQKPKHIKNLYMFFTESR